MKDEFFIIPEHALKYEKVSRKAGDALNKLLSDPNVTCSETEHAALWLAANPNGIRAMLSSEPAYWVVSGPSPRRGRMTDLPETSDENAARHRHLLSEVCRNLCANAKARHPHASAEIAAALSTIASNLAEPYLQFLQRQNWEDANPVYAWEAYALCRQFGIKIPDWVLAYFDECAAGIEGLVEKPPQSIGGKISQALMFSGDVPKPGSTIRRAHRRRENMRYYAIVLDHISSGMGRGEAIAKTVTDEAVGKTRLSAIYDDFRRALGVRIGDVDDGVTEI